VFRKIYPSEYYRKFLIHDVRPDGRGMSKVRKTTVSTGSIRTADGSAFVKIGQTSVVAGVVAEVGIAEEGKTGQVVVNIELPPLCSAKNRPGKPSEQALVIDEYLDQIAHSVVSLEGLSIGKEEADESETKQQYVWYIYVDMYCLNDDGNTTDACVIALLAALTNAQIPQVIITQEGNVYMDTTKPKMTLKIKHYPIPLTFATIDDFLFADPSSQEEALMNGSITVIYSNNGQLFSVLKGGSPISEDQLRECIERAKLRVTEVLQLIQNPSTKHER